jgi:beta-barrel assembly-enhancing protease
MIRGWPLALLMLAAPSYAAPKPEDIAAHRLLAAQDARVANVGYRLAQANARFCSPKPGFNPGWVVNDINLYPDPETAKAAFGLIRPVAISAIVAGGPADMAGLKTGDGIVAINGRDMATLTPNSSPATARLEAFRKLLSDSWVAKNPAKLTIDRKGTVLDLSFQPGPVCPSYFWVETRDRVDAGADGEGVRLTTGLLRFISNDDELAYVAAHELAHNLLGHRARLNGLKRGKTKATYATEVEADRLSVWLMANAGYDGAAALRFAERFGRKYGGGLFAAGTHPRWKDRVASMRAELVAMEATMPVGGLRTPPLLDPQ